MEFYKIYVVYHFYMDELSLDKINVDQNNTTQNNVRNIITKIH